MRIHARLMFWVGVVLLCLTSTLLSNCTSRNPSTLAHGGASDVQEVPTPTSPAASPRAQSSEPTKPFYGMWSVSQGELGLIRGLGIEVVLVTFNHNDSPARWRSNLDAAQAAGVQVIAWLWPQGWRWNGSRWEIDAQARMFLETVKDHPALFAVYGLHEPYWNNCWGCGYTTAQQQALYRAIKAIADVPIHSSVDSMAFWTEQGAETAFADGICDYCGTWYYPFLADGRYEREELIARVRADVAVARERAPNSKVVWALQSFAQPGKYRMPNAEEMRDLAEIVLSSGVDGVLWHVWRFNPLYSDFLANHPELHPVVREIYQEYVQPANDVWPGVYLPLVTADFHPAQVPPAVTATNTPAPTATAMLTPTPAGTPTAVPGPTQPLYGMWSVPQGELGLVRGLGIEVVLATFNHNDSPARWRSNLDAAQAAGIQVIAWLWPQGWRWNGSRWEIDAQARMFLETVKDHPALFAVYGLHEPYWNNCWGCGYTTAQQQALYRAIKAIADVPIHSSVDSMAFWTEQGAETAFADGICDYCETWYYPFLADGRYEREELIARVRADVAVARERAPNSKVVWALQSFAQPGKYRMPNAEEMRDLAEIVFSSGVDGVLWHVWRFSWLYSDFLANHPELHPVVREIHDTYVVSGN